MTRKLKVGDIVVLNMDGDDVGIPTGSIGEVTHVRENGLFPVDVSFGNADDAFRPSELYRLDSVE